MGWPATPSFSFFILIFFIILILIFFLKFINILIFNFKYDTWRNIVRWIKLNGEDLRKMKLSYFL